MSASRIVLPFLATIALAGAPVFAQGGVPIGARKPLLSGTDGRWLSKACGSQQPGDRSFCYGYVLAIADQLAVNGTVCRPATVSADQLVQLVRSHLAARPGDLTRHASYLIGRVLGANYPCSR